MSFQQGHAELTNPSYEHPEWNSASFRMVTQHASVPSRDAPDTPFLDPEVTKKYLAAMRAAFEIKEVPHIPEYTRERIGRQGIPYTCFRRNDSGIGILSTNILKNCSRGKRGVMWGRQRPRIWVPHFRYFFLKFNTATFDTRFWQKCPTLCCLNDKIFTKIVSFFNLRRPSYVLRVFF